MSDTIAVALAVIAGCAVLAFMFWASVVRPDQTAIDSVKVCGRGNVEHVDGAAFTCRRTP